MSTNENIEIYDRNVRAVEIKEISSLVQPNPEAAMYNPFIIRMGPRLAIDTKSIASEIDKMGFEIKWSG